MAKSFFAPIIQRFASAFHILREHCSWHNLNPFNWSTAQLKLFLISFLAIMLPVYFLIGLQPSVPADAASYPHLEIPSINLTTPVATLQLEDRQLIAPAAIAGVYSNSPNKLFIIGHSSTVFKKLNQTSLGDTITYDGINYRIQNSEVLPKAAISMREILQPEEQETIVIMTCAGEPLPNQDATHRLIVTATREG